MHTLFEKVFLYLLTAQKHKKTKPLLRKISLYPSTAQKEG